MFSIYWKNGKSCKILLIKAFNGFRVDTCIIKLYWTYITLETQMSFYPFNSNILSQIEYHILFCLGSSFQYDKLKAIASKFYMIDFSSKVYQAIMSCFA